MKPLFIWILLFACPNLICAQAGKKGIQTFHLRFETTFDGFLLHTDSTYQNHFGEALQVRSFKYYISHLQLQYTDGKIYSLPLPPHLINEADSVSKRLSFSAPSGVVTNIHFLIGIDSTTNTTGVQTGDLDPVKGMFWIWNTGYIMAKLEGSSPASKAPAKQYSYDIGGYKAGENVIQPISLSLPPTINQPVTSFIISADVSKWFYGKNDIRISEQPMCHSPGKLAMQIAANYADMFSFRAE